MGHNYYLKRQKYMDKKWTNSRGKNLIVAKHNAIVTDRHKNKSGHANLQTNDTALFLW